MIYFEPYHSWSGHYAQYIGELATNTDSIVKNSSADNGIFKKKPTNGLLFTYSRFHNCFVCLLKLLFFIFKNRKNLECRKVHLIDFEPLSTLVFLPFLVFFKVKIICTVHSVQAKNINNFVLNIFARIQKLCLFIFLKYSNSTVVVHNETHLNLLLLKVPEIKNRAFVINYPCPIVSDDVKARVALRSSHLLVAGIMRVDKGIFDFLDSASNNIKLLSSISLLGLIEDKRILKYTGFLNSYKDEYIDYTELRENYLKVPFLLIPYGEDYTGGAGPLMDAMSHGLPVIVSSNITLKKFVKKNNVGLVYSNVDDILDMINSVSDFEYNSMSKNAIEFAKNNCWKDFRSKYDEEVY